MPMAPSVCRMCGQRFRSSKSLQQHMKVKGHVTRTMELPSSTKHRTETKMQGTKPEYSYSHALVTSGHTMPEALLAKLVAENRTIISAGIRTKGAMEKEIFAPMAPTAEKSLDFMKKFMENTKEFTRIVSFHQLPAEYDEDVEIQPYAILKDSKGNALLYVAIEGDFPEFVDSSPDHFSEASRLVVDWLGPKVDAIFKTGSNHPQKLFDYLNSDDFAKDFAEKVGHRGSLTFLPVTGPAFTVSHKNELGVTGDWGTASIAYGYTEAVTNSGTPAAQEVKTEPKPKAQKSKYVTEEEPTTAPAAEPLQAPLNPGQEMVEEEKVMTPPTGLHGKPLKNWYRATTPDKSLPVDWRDRPSVKVLVKKPVTGAAPKKPDTAIAAAMAAADVNKTLVMPIIGGDKQKASNDFIKKFTGDGSAIITDPKETGEREAKLAKFSELHGEKDLAFIDRWRTEFMAAYMREHPEASWLMVIELRNELRRVRDVVAKMADGTVKVGELVKTGTSTPAPATVPQEEKKVATGGKSKYF